MYKYTKQNRENRKQEMKSIMEKLESGVKSVFASDQYKNYLSTMAKFPRYSANNCLLILMQKPKATLVQSYTGWKKMGRFVKKGEKGIRILAPVPYTVKATEVVEDECGNKVEKEVIVGKMTFMPVSTFDVSQTDGEDLPTYGVDELIGTVEGYKRFFEAIKKAAKVPVAFEKMEGSCHGYYHKEENRIAICEGMSEIQTIKTLIHESAHARLHNKDAQKKREGGPQSTPSIEVEAESVAYTVCQHYGIDTSDYSFAYVAGWSSDKKLNELKESLNTIQKAASEIIDTIDKELKKAA